MAGNKLKLVAWDADGDYNARETSGLTTGTWQFVAWRWQSGVATVFVDGTSVTGPSAGAAIRSCPAGSFEIGRYHPGGVSFDGKIDEVSVFSRALSDSEISQVRNNAAPAPAPGEDGSTPPPPPAPTASPAVSPPEGGSFPVIDSGDYDGDGTSEIAVFRPSVGLWAVRGTTRCYFGAAGDIPAGGDYDGDGTAEIGLFRPGSGLWAIRGVSRSYYGRPGDLPVPADYDGDGAAEAGVFRPDGALWAVRGVTMVYFGSPGDLPVAGYYDGSGPPRSGSSGRGAVCGRSVTSPASTSGGTATVRSPGTTPAPAAGKRPSSAPPLDSGPSGA